MAVTVTKIQARRFLLEKQLLLPPYSLSGKEGIRTVFDRLRIVQFDPLNPCGCNPDLVLQSRIKDYHPQDYFGWLYKEKNGIEVYDKELCIIPIEDFSLVTYLHVKAQKHPRIKAFLKKYQREIEDIIQLISRNGPITSREVQNSLRIDSWWGTRATFGRVALEFLFETGRVFIVKREKGRKYYGLPGKNFEALDGKRFEKIERAHVLRRLSSVGILPKSGSGGGWQGLGATAEISKIINQLIKERILLEVDVLKTKKTFVVSMQDQELLEKEMPPPDSEVSFIAPLDTLMWDRNMIEDLFDFRYRWEVYTPLKKREFGYYVLPILYQDTFIGRIEPVLKDSTLYIRGVWMENRFKKDDRVKKALDLALEQFRKYCNAKRIEFST